MRQHSDRFIVPQGAALGLIWLLACLTLCPPVGAAMALVLDAAWAAVAPAAHRISAVLFDGVRGAGAARRLTAEALCALNVAAIAAAGVAILLGLAKATWSARVEAIVALFPACLVVMLAPAGVVFVYVLTLDNGWSGARSAAEFLELFAGLATAVALAYAVWIHLYRRSFAPHVGGEAAAAGMKIWA